MFNQVHLTALAGMKSFSFGDFFMTNQDSGCPLGEEAMRKRLRGLVKSGEVVRVGRNAYCVSGNKMSSYRHEYSEEANTVAQALREAFPAVEFTIFELVQLNEFVNHQLAHNVLFLSVEDDIIDFVFDLLKEQFPGKVLLDADGAASPRSWAEGTVPGICENSVRAKKALDWIGEMSRDGACAASLCSHDPDVTPQTIKF